jgi:hypothetical protein
MATTMSSSRMPARSAGPPGTVWLMSAPPRSTCSPSIEYTANRSSTAMIMCMIDPAEMTSRRFGKLC